MRGGPFQRLGLALDSSSVGLSVTSHRGLRGLPIAIADQRGWTHREAQPLELQDVVYDGTHTLVLSGELDLASAAELNRRLLPICRDANNVVLDLRQLTFIDASGLHIMVVAKEVCTRHETEFGLVPGPKHVQRVFQLTGLLAVLPFQCEPAS